MNLIPDTLYSGLNDILGYVSAQEIRQMDHQPHYHIARFDTVGYYIDTTSITPDDEQDIMDVAAVATDAGPITYLRVYEEFENIFPYDSTEATTFSHGANVFGNGSHITNIATINTQIQDPLAVDGTTNGRIKADVYVNGLDNVIWKELAFRYTAHAGVVGRPSVMNLNPGMPTDKDFQIYTLKHHIQKEMFRTDKTPTQNISVNYITDNNDITP